MRLLFHFQAVPLTKQLTHIAGNLWSMTLGGGSRANRNEYLLLHEFTQRDYICPDKIMKDQQNEEELDEPKEEDEHKEPEEPAHASTSKQSKRRKPKYAGGLVLDPKRGFYDTFILLLDFNSLYPSIIQEYNIDFTTVERAVSIVIHDV